MIRQRKSNLKHKYDLSIEEYENMNKEQNGLCAICNKPQYSAPPFITKLVVDHDHKTNKVRGLLCNKCNQALGLFQDNIENLKNAVKYLQR